MGARLSAAVASAASALVQTVLASPAIAEIKDYQIARMLNFRTECNLVALERLPPLEGEVERFSGECGNRTFYPDGIVVSCPEENDEWACKVVTDKKSFEHLELLRQDR